MNHILAAGCTGLIGQKLVPALRAAGYSLSLLTRNPEDSRQKFNHDSHLQFVQWDGLTDPITDEMMTDVSGIINLAGVGIADQRWTPSRKTQLHDSRVKPTRAAAHAAAKHQVPLINASAIGWYGWPAEPVDESAPAGETYLAKLTAEWEAALKPAQDAGVRTVALRIAAVLDPAGGALAEMVRPLLPLAVLGNGQQMFTWVHVDDVVGMILAALSNEQWQGPVNVVAPATDSLKTVMRAIREQTGKMLMPLGVPGWALRLVLGELADMLLNGAIIEPQRAREWGYQWQHAEIASAIAACYPRAAGVDA